MASDGLMAVRKGKIIDVFSKIVNEDKKISSLF